MTMNQLPHQALDFVATAAPFNLLTDEERQKLAKQAEVFYLTEQNKTQLLEDAASKLYLINSGQFEVKDSQAEARGLSEGDFFAYQALINQPREPLSVSVNSSGLIYSWPLSVIQPLVEQHKEIAAFFTSHQYADIASHAISNDRQMWLYKRLSEQLSGKLVTSPTTISIRQAAKLMAKQKVSCLMLTEDEKLTGIITDRDLRNRVLAAEVSPSLDAAQIMTANPVAIGQDKTLFDALCLMTEHNIHHLPVTHQHKPVGMVTASDIVRQQRGNTLFIINELTKANSLYELSRLSWQLPHYFASYASRLGDFDIAGKVLAQATDIMTRKLLAFFIEKQGPAPIPYCWLVYGSQARQDQTLGSDQDNGLLLASTPNEEEAAYFAAMSDYVCQGLAKCGIKLCNGNIMASNPKLRLSVEQAVAEAKSWVSAPTPEVIMHFNIFLDVRPVAGDIALFTQLQDARRPLFQQQQFLAALARHANSNHVPLSLFQRFVFKQADKLDLKVDAVAIINNLVRIYALKSGIQECATPDRLQHLTAQSGLVEKDAQNLRDIWLLLNRLRWHHQIHSKKTDNLVSISELSAIQKHQLKAAFKAIKGAQEAAIIKFSAGMG